MKQKYSTAQLRRYLLEKKKAEAPHEGAALDWQAFLKQYCASATTSDPSPRHVRLWEWAESLERGTRPKAYVVAWPRGGGKSTTLELICVRLCATLERRFVLYVSSTQLKANKHVAAISTRLEALGVKRSVNEYGISRGWSADMLRTANGFNVLALGLDAGTRGVKLDEFRPDLIILDDVDELHDTLETTKKKEETITSTILPSGSTDCAVAFAQNLVHEDSLMAQMVDGRADWLADREEVSCEPSLWDCEIVSVPGESGVRRWKITKGTPSWEGGQSLAVCQADLDTFGRSAYEREFLHKVRGAQGTVFNVGWYKVGDPFYSPRHTIEAEKVPSGVRRCEAWDLAGTEGGGDYTARVRLGIRGTYPTVEAFLIEVEVGQWGTDRVRNKLKNSAVRLPKGCMLRLPRDPGQAGLFQENQLRRDLQAHAPRIRPVSGSKATRARGLAECMNLGNLYLVRGDWMSAPVEGTNLQTLPWLLDVFRRFTEDESHEIDDPVDAAADAYNELALYPDPTPEEVERDRYAWWPEPLRSSQVSGIDEARGTEEYFGSSRVENPLWD